MRITEEEVRNVADLANLKATDAEVIRFRADLDEILTHVDRLNQLSVTDVEPMTKYCTTPAKQPRCARIASARTPGNAAALGNAPLNRRRLLQSAESD